MADNYDFQHPKKLIELYIQVHEISGSQICVYVKDEKEISNSLEYLNYFQ